MNDEKWIVNNTNKNQSSFENGFSFGSPCWARTSDNLINSQDGYFLKHSRMECFDATLTLNTRILLVSVISRRKTIHRIVFLGPSTSFARSVGEQLNADKVCGRSNPTRKTKKNTPDWVCSFLAPPAGLEPATTWLTVRCSTDWAKEEYPRWPIFPDRRQSSIVGIT